MNEPNKTLFNKSRSIIITGLFSIIIFLIAIYSSYFIVINDMENQTIRIVDSIERNTLPLRGGIYDSNGRQLAKNIPRLKLSIIPNQLTEESNGIAKLRLIEDVTGIEISKLENILINGLNSNDLDRPITIIDALSNDDAIIYSNKFANVKGIKIIKDVMREYEPSSLFSRILGNTGLIDQSLKDEYIKKGYSLDAIVGKSGLEFTYEDALKGNKGKQTINNNNEKIILEQKATNGQDLYLAIDYDLQKKSYETLLKYANKGIIDSEIETDNILIGSVIMIDVNSGNILSYVSIPDYKGTVFSGLGNDSDLNNLFIDSSKPLLDRNIMENYPPGSIFKPIVGIGALEENIANENTTINTKGYITIQSELDPSIEYVFNDWAVHGPLDFKEGLARSSDVYYYYLSGGYIDENENFNGLGVEKINEYATKFGLGTTTGIDLPGEINGLVPSKKWKDDTLNEPWVIGDTYQLGIGQSYLRVSPTQMVVAIAAIANNGYIVTPKIVKEIRNNENIYQYTTKNKEINIKKSSITLMKESMKLAADPYGTAHAGEPKGMTIGGKTGTAEFGTVAEKTKYKTHGWFAGFAPYDEPEVAIITFLNIGVGSTHAAPIAKEILDFYFKRIKNLNSMSTY
ncbi:MAG: penicillin-binding protein 2 [Chloroflexi bacterium]|jgi:penicillin-binding protein 2|nr:MAG: penicillin-binding protein 2 [Chloroflexota bacterium]